MDVASAMEHMEQSRDEAIDLPRLIVGVRRRRRWIYFSAIAAAVLSSAFVLLASPRYTGVAKVLLEDQESYYTRPDKASGADSAATIDPEAVQSEAEAVMSPDLARKAIERLDLAANPEFAVSRRREQRPRRPAGRRQVPVAPHGFPGAQVAGASRSNSSRAIPSWPRAPPTRSPRCFCNRRRKRRRRPPGPQARGSRAKSRNCAPRSPTRTQRSRPTALKRASSPERTARRSRSSS